MANDDNDSDKPTIEQGGTGILERGRPDGLGSPSNDQPVLPSREKVTVPSGFPRRRK